ncbi:hypothetical protein F4821DRAFT_58162 [Hypoxylon rubiginosum]|uniref:Uncharacterized protein n=1 Tax=Hypoxylon rubiginosum TaxID=110542 RepID=A0ACC0DAB9_9PEZI|nr:hypothetical protein F4821DRAFT_58162 [Hypoxylon rubiginosum]
MIAWLITFSVEYLAHCQPINYYWKPPVEGGFCLNTYSVYLGNAITAVAIDLLILIIPVPLVWRLKLSTIRKVMVTFVFIMGYGVIAASIGRLVAVYNAGDAINTDLTYAGMAMYYWFMAEAAIALISICLPAIWFLFTRVGRHGLLSLFSHTKYLNRVHYGPRNGSLESNRSEAILLRNYNGPGRDYS